MELALTAWEAWVTSLRIARTSLTVDAVVRAAKEVTAAEVSLYDPPFLRSVENVEAGRTTAVEVVAVIS